MVVVMFCFFFQPLKLFKEYIIVKCFIIINWYIDAIGWYGGSKGLVVVAAGKEMGHVRIYSVFMLPEGRAYCRRFVRPSHFCQEHISKSIEGNLMKLDTLVEGHEGNCRMQEL